MLVQGRGIDASLNDTGLQQAKSVAHYFKDIDLSRIYSSSLKRSQQTAEVVSQVKKIEVQSYPSLDEMNFGDLEGKPIVKIRPRLKKLYHSWKAGDIKISAPNGESPLCVWNRASKRIESLLSEQNKNESMLFVLHGRLLRILIAGWIESGLQYMYKITHSNGALYHLQRRKDEFEPVYLHRTDHLYQS
jgi:probable phosphoglycerate mutase